MRENYAMKIELKNSWIYKHFFSKYCSEVEITFLTATTISAVIKMEHLD